jgi:hypothetical protein
MSPLRINADEVLAVMGEPGCVPILWQTLRAF